MPLATQRAYDRLAGIADRGELYGIAVSHRECLDRQTGLVSLHVTFVVQDAPSMVLVEYRAGPGWAVFGARRQELARLPDLDDAFDLALHELRRRVQQLR